MSQSLSSKLVLGDDGLVDMDASCAAFRAVLESYVAERELESETIAKAVNDVFDERRGCGMNLPALTGFALAKLNAQPSNYAVLEEKVKQYIRNNSDRPASKKTGDPGESPRTRLFGIRRGRQSDMQGSVIRWSDHPERPESK